MAVIDPHRVGIGFEEHAIVLTGIVGSDDLILEEDEHHAKGHEVLGDVPEFGGDPVDDMEVIAELSNREDGGPGEQAEGDGDGSTGDAVEGADVNQADDEVDFSQQGRDADIETCMQDAPEQPACERQGTDHDQRPDRD